MTQECIFCKIINGEIPAKKIFENDKVLAFLDIFPMSQGHTVIIPKKHFNHFENVDSSTIAEVFNTIQYLGRFYLKIPSIEGFNVLVNNYSAAGQVIEHFHVHLIPRKTNDGIISHKIPKEQASEEELNEFLEIFSKIKN